MKQWLNIFGFLLAFSPLHIVAQNVEAFSRLTHDTIAPGQQLGMELQMKVPAGFVVNWPVFNDTLTGSVEIINRSATETTAADAQGNKTIHQKFVLTAFDTGWVYIPAVNIGFTPDGDTTAYTVQTNPLMLRVQPVAIDTTATFKPIKDTEGAPLTLADFLPWIIGIHLLAAIIFLVMWFLKKRRRRQQPAVSTEIPGLPPHELAIEKLEQLRLEKLWQQGQLKAYHTRLSDIVREYIERQFPVNAVEMTTHEILTALKPMKINEDAMQKLRLALELADMVKFAKAQPGALENDMSLNHLIDFVKESHHTAASLPAEKEELP